MFGKSGENVKLENEKAVTVKVKKKGTQKKLIPERNTKRKKLENKINQKS